MSYRPSWIVLAPSTKAAARKASGVSDEIWNRWTVVAGRKGYVAIAELEPGASCTGESELIERLSRAISGRHYLLALAPHAHDPDHGTDYTHVHEDGKHIGRLDVLLAGTVATHFGCTVPNLVKGDREKITAADLKVIAPRKSRRKPSSGG